MSYLKKEYDTNFFSEGVFVLINNFLEKKGIKSNDYVCIYDYVFYENLKKFDDYEKKSTHDRKLFKRFIRRNTQYSTIFLNFWKYLWNSRYRFESLVEISNLTEKYHEYSHSELKGIYYFMLNNPIYFDKIMKTIGVIGFDPCHIYFLIRGNRLDTDFYCISRKKIDKVDNEIKSLQARTFFKPKNRIRELRLFLLNYIIYVGG